MDSSVSEGIPRRNHEKAARMLTRGRELVLRLQHLTREPSMDGGLVFAAGELVEELLSSLNNARTMLGRANITENRPVANACVSTPIGPPRPASDDDADHVEKTDCKRSGINKTIGGCRMRKYPHYSITCTRATFDDDGYMWKKYGQKVIIGAKYQRSYYRCAQRTDQGCLATKQVQKANDDPSMFVVTYVGQHTCQKELHALEDAHAPRQQFINNFGANNKKPGNTQDPPAFSFLARPGQGQGQHLSLRERTTALPSAGSAAQLSSNAYSTRNMSSITSTEIHHLKERYPINPIETGMIQTLESPKIGPMVASDPYSTAPVMQPTSNSESSETGIIEDFESLLADFWFHDEDHRFG